jgi:hypothetical protein
VELAMGLGGFQVLGRYLGRFGLYAAFILRPRFAWRYFMAAWASNGCSIFGGTMFACLRPVNRPVRKPITKAMEKQIKSETRLRRFDQAMFVVYGAMGVILLFEVV